jgi:hypothetical protein
MKIKFNAIFVCPIIELINANKKQVIYKNNKAIINLVLKK